MIRFALALLLLIFAFPALSHASCRFTSGTDNISLEETSGILCADYMGAGSFDSRNPTVGFQCFSGNIGVLIDPGQFNFIGGDLSTLTIRGDAQDTPVTLTGRVSRSGGEVIIFVTAEHVVIDAFLRSGQVFIRYTDYRNVSHDIQISASGFTNAFSQMPCEAPAPTSAPASTEGAASQPVLTKP